ncbi:MFS transporter [bacterium]|nr:MFS transporter [bacterium]
MRFLLVLLMFLLSMLLYVDRSCISVAEEHIAESLHLSETQMGWVFSAFALGYALFQTPGGYLADRFGPRIVLSAVVTFWSIFTGLTAAAWNLISMLIVRFLFGMGEAGAFPNMARSIYSWIPMKERGLVQGINFSASRLGAAITMPIIAYLIVQVGWKMAFVILALVGFVWTVIFYIWFRNEPGEHPLIKEKELQYILANRQQPAAGEEEEKLTPGLLFGSKNMWLAMLQYFCSNFTFFFCLTWLFPYLKATYELEAVHAGFYAMMPFIGGAIGNVFAGAMVDYIYRRGNWALSRQLTAAIGFFLAALGLIVSVYMTTALTAVIFLTIAIFGADMTLSPSWSVCIDIGRKHSGTVSGTMNMAGNLGSFITALAFPYLAAWTGSYTWFFFVGAGLNVLAIAMWFMIKPTKRLEEY